MKIDRSKRPTDTIPGNFQLPKIQEFQLDNGIDVYLVENKKLPIMKMSLVLPAGSRFDPYGNEGLAYLTALTLDEGAGEYNALELANEIDKLGSSIELSASVDHIFLNLTSLEENFENTVKLFSKIIEEPLFDKESFNREKSKQITKINQMFDDPSYIASNAFQKITFAGTGYEKPIVGYSSSVNHIDRVTVKNYYSKLLKTRKAKLFVVSSAGKESVEQLLNRHLGKTDFSASGRNEKYEFQKGGQSLYFVHKEGAAQSEIVAGSLVPPRNDKHFFPAKLANSILGGQFTSRLNLNLREDKGYTYGAHSSISYNQLTGYFSLSTSVQSDYTVKSIKEIQKELQLIKDRIDKNEIEFAKSSLVKQFPSMFETYSQLLRRINSLVLFDLPIKYYDEYIQNIWDVTPDEILDASRHYFTNEDINYFVVGDKNKIGSDLDLETDLEFIELDKFGNRI